MGLAEQQQVLARLYSSGTFRDQFFNDTSGLSPRLALDTRDGAQFRGLVRAQVEFFARSLRRKRLKEVGKLLPLTCGWLGDALAPLFERFAEGSPPHGRRPHHADALAFALFVAEQRGQPRWVQSVATYESQWLSVTTEGFRGLRVQLTRWPSPGADRGGICLSRQPTSITWAAAIWIRVAGSEHVRHWFLPLFKLPAHPDDAAGARQGDVRTQRQGLAQEEFHGNL